MPDKNLQILEKAASGSFSRVYRAFDPDLQRFCAVKVFVERPEKMEGLPYGPDQWRERFIAEARFLAAFNHPYVVPVYDFGRLEDGSPFMVMPWLPANLRGEIGRDSFDAQAIEAMAVNERPRTLPAKRAIAVLRQICAALSALHQNGVVHRDVKPTNILLTRLADGDVRLCDFGMMRGGGFAGESRAGVWIGTQDYMAPEQREDASRAGPAADVYALGATAYRMLTGKVPAGAFEPPSQTIVGIEAWLDDWVMDSMNPDPAKRPSAMSLAVRLGRQGLDRNASRLQS